MKKVCKFNEYLVLKESRRTGSKTGLYPLGYGGVGLYPDADMMTQSADAVFYLSIDNRLFNNGDEAPFSITHLPGHKQYEQPNSGENSPFDINHIPGDIITPKDSPLSGKSMPFKSFVKLIEKPKEIMPPDSPNIPK